MTAWRVLEWSRALGRGAITSPHFARVEFDAACAAVDDFSVGEAVHVELLDTDASIRVRRIWPDLPRFPEHVGAPTAATLATALASEAETAIASASGWPDVRIELASERVRLVLDDDAFAYGPSAMLDLHEPSYVELPTAIETVRFIHLSRAAERNYLATRVALGASAIAVSIIDDKGRFYFVVARRCRSCA